MNEYLIFIGIVLVATGSPGPAVFLAMKNGAIHGFGCALMGILGNISALLTMATISILGVGAVILASATLFMLLKVLGGLYLIYLGVRLWFSRPQMTVLADGNRSGSKAYLSLFLEAYGVGMSNPKAIAFCVALFPQFVHLEQAVLPQFALLVGTFLFFSAFFLSLYAGLAAGLRGYLLRPVVLGWFNRVTGGVFVGFGAVLVAGAGSRA